MRMDALFMNEIIEENEDPSAQDEDDNTSGFAYFHADMIDPEYITLLRQPVLNLSPCSINYNGALTLGSKRQVVRNNTFHLARTWSSNKNSQFSESPLRVINGQQTHNADALNENAHPGLNSGGELTPQDRGVRSRKFLHISSSTVGRFENEHTDGQSQIRSNIVGLNNDERSEDVTSSSNLKQKMGRGRNIFRISQKKLQVQEFQRKRQQSCLSLRIFHCFEKNKRNPTFSKTSQNLHKLQKLTRAHSTVVQSDKYLSGNLKNIGNFGFIKKKILGFRKRDDLRGTGPESGGGASVNLTTHKLINTSNASKKFKSAVKRREERSQEGYTASEQAPQDNQQAKKLSQQKLLEVDSNRCEKYLGELRENDDSPECLPEQRARRLIPLPFEIANANVEKQEHDEVLRDSSLAYSESPVDRVLPPQRSHSDRYKSSIFHVDEDGRRKVTAVGKQLTIISECDATGRYREEEKFYSPPQDPNASKHAPTAESHSLASSDASIRNEDQQEENKEIYETIEEDEYQLEEHLGAKRRICRQSGTFCHGRPKATRHLSLQSNSQSSIARRQKNHVSIKKQIVLRMKSLNQVEEQMASLKYLHTLGNHLKNFSRRKNANLTESKNLYQNINLQDLANMKMSDLNLTKFETDFLYFTRQYMNYKDDVSYQQEGQGSATDRQGSLSNSVSTITQEEEEQGEGEQGFDDCNQHKNSETSGHVADNDISLEGLEELRKPTKCNSSKALELLIRTESGIVSQSQQKSAPFCQLSRSKSDEELANKYQLGLPKLSEQNEDNCSASQLASNYSKIEGRESNDKVLKIQYWTFPQDKIESQESNSSFQSRPQSSCENGPPLAQVQNEIPELAAVQNNANQSKGHTESNGNGAGPKKMKNAILYEIKSIMEDDEDHSDSQASKQADENVRYRSNAVQLDNLQHTNHQAYAQTNDPSFYNNSYSQSMQTQPHTSFNNNSNGRCKSSNPRNEWEPAPVPVGPTEPSIENQSISSNSQADKARTGNSRGSPAQSSAKNICIKDVNVVYHKDQGQARQHFQQQVTRKNNAFAYNMDTNHEIPARESHRRSNPTGQSVQQSSSIQSLQSEESISELRKQNFVIPGQQLIADLNLNNDDSNMHMLDDSPDKGADGPSLQVVGRFRSHQSNTNDSKNENSFQTNVTIDKFKLQNKLSSLNQQFAGNMKSSQTPQSIQSAKQSGLSSCDNQPIFYPSIYHSEKQFHDFDKQNFYNEEDGSSNQPCGNRPRNAPPVEGRNPNDRQQREEDKYEMQSSGQDDDDQNINQSPKQNSQSNEELYKLTPSHNKSVIDSQNTMNKYHLKLISHCKRYADSSVKSPKESHVSPEDRVNSVRQQIKPVLVKLFQDEGATDQLRIQANQSYEAAEVEQAEANLRVNAQHLNIRTTFDSIEENSQQHPSIYTKSPLSQNPNDIAFPNQNEEVKLQTMPDIYQQSQEGQYTHSRNNNDRLIQYNSDQHPYSNSGMNAHHWSDYRFGAPQGYPQINSSNRWAQQLQAYREQQIGPSQGHDSNGPYPPQRCQTNNSLSAVPECKIRSSRYGGPGAHQSPGTAARMNVNQISNIPAEQSAALRISTEEICHAQNSTQQRYNNALYPSRQAPILGTHQSQQMNNDKIMNYSNQLSNRINAEIQDQISQDGMSRNHDSLNTIQQLQRGVSKLPTQPFVYRAQNQSLLHNKHPQKKRAQGNHQKQGLTIVPERPMQGRFQQGRFRTQHNSKQNSTNISPSQSAMRVHSSNQKSHELQPSNFLNNFKKNLQDLDADLEKTINASQTQSFYRAGDYRTSQQRYARGRPMAQTTKNSSANLRGYKSLFNNTRENSLVTNEGERQSIANLTRKNSLNAHWVDLANSIQAPAMTPKDMQANFNLSKKIARKNKNITKYELDFNNKIQKSRTRSVNMSKSQKAQQSMFFTPERRSLISQEQSKERCGRKSCGESLEHILRNIETGLGARVKVRNPSKSKYRNDANLNIEGQESQFQRLQQERKQLSQTIQANNQQQFDLKQQFQTQIRKGSKNNLQIASKSFDLQAPNRQTNKSQHHRSINSSHNNPMYNQQYYQTTPLHFLGQPHYQGGNQALNQSPFSELAVYDHQQHMQPTVNYHLRNQRNMQEGALGKPTNYSRCIDTRSVYSHNPKNVLQYQQKPSLYSHIIQQPSMLNQTVYQQNPNVPRNDISLNSSMQYSLNHQAFDVVNQQDFQSYPIVNKQPRAQMRHPPQQPYYNKQKAAPEQSLNFNSSFIYQDSQSYHTNIQPTSPVNTSVAGQSFYRADSSTPAHAPMNSRNLGQAQQIGRYSHKSTGLNRLSPW